MRVNTPTFRCLMGLVCLVMLPLTWAQLHGQNLVPNPSFEQTGTIPCTWVTSSSSFSNAVSNWVLPTNGTPDVHATFVGGNCWNAQPTSNYGGFECWRGGQSPRTGQVMVGLFTVVNAGSWREYAQVKFSSPMVPGMSYDVGFYASLANSSSMATNNLGFHLSTSPVSGAWGHLAVTPQYAESSVISDTSGWVWIGTTIIATAPHEYITIGNFSPNANTDIVARPQQCDGAYYFIDDVCVSLSANAICASVLDPQLLSFSATAEAAQFVACHWEVAATTGISHFEVQRSTDGQHFENIATTAVQAGTSTYAFQDRFPLAGKTYYRILQADQDGLQYLSEVLEVEFVGAPGLTVYPNPATNSAVFLHASHLTDTQAYLHLADPAGKTLYQGVHPIVQGQLQIKLSELATLAPGMYIVSCKTSKFRKSVFFFVD